MKARPTSPQINCLLTTSPTSRLKWPEYCRREEGKISRDRIRLIVCFPSNNIMRVFVYSFSEAIILEYSKHSNISHFYFFFFHFYSERCEPYRDLEGKQLGPYRVWLADDDIPGLAMARSFGDIIASQVGVICEPGKFALLN